jgi:hypothetical protein
VLDHKVTTILFIILSFIVLVIGVEIGSGQSLETYENSQPMFKFQYSSRWIPTILERSNGVSFDLNPESSSNRTDIFVKVFPIYGSFHDYFRQYISERVGIDYSTLRTNETIVGGFPATMAIWDTKDDTITLTKALSVFVARDGTLYRIHYEIGPEVLNDYLPQVNNIIKSFVITR